jgi:YbbR-like protein
MRWRERIRAVRPRDVGESLRWLVLHNAGIKLLSLVAAIGLWFFVNAGERDTELSLQVPVELRNVPPNVMLVSPRVDFIDLVVRGPRTLLSRIQPDQLSMALDLRGVRPGPAVFRIMSEALDLPRGVTVLRLTPSEVTLEFAATMRKRVPVHVAVAGKPPSGLRVTATKAAPESVEVVGPADQVEQIKTAETVPVELADAPAGLIERDVGLDAPPEYVSFSASLVHAQVLLEEPERTRTIVSVPVVVRNSAYRTALTPPVMQITVRGPRSTIESLELEQGAVYIDATGREPGEYEVTPAVDLPADIELIKQEPSSIVLRVLRQKRKADGG